jgi:hypothetical protein
MYTHCLDAPNYMYKWTTTMVKVRQDLACYIRIYAWHSTSNFVCKSLHVMYHKYFCMKFIHSKHTKLKSNANNKIC